MKQQLVKSITSEVDVQIMLSIPSLDIREDKQSHDFLQEIVKSLHVVKIYNNKLWYMRLNLISIFH